jgi:hypothetical protein
VLPHGRSDARLADRLREIAEATGSERLRTYRADFSSLDDVRRLAERVLAEEELIGPRVRVLAISSKRFPMSSHTPSRESHGWRLARATAKCGEDAAIARLALWRTRTAELLLCLSDDLVSAEES